MKGPFNITDDNLKIVYSDNKNFKNLWSKFLKAYDQYSYKYVIDVLDYYLLISNKAINRSFLIQNHEEVLAICPLIIEKVKNSCKAQFIVEKIFYQ